MQSLGKLEQDKQDVTETRKEFHNVIVEGKKGRSLRSEVPGKLNDAPP